MTQEIPAGVERDHPLTRLTTVRTGGAARYFARPGTSAAVVELLAWADQAAIAVGVIGSGSNLLVSDAGFDGLAMKLDGELRTIEIDGATVVCGGGARLPQVSARSADHGLDGLQFGVNIPGTVGGAIRMNANAYGGALAEVLESAEIATPDGIVSRGPHELGFEYRKSNVSGYQVVTSARFVLRSGDRDKIKQEIAAMRARRKEAQPSGIKTFGSTFKNPDDPAAEGRTAGQLLAAAGCSGIAVGSARFSPKHANFVENTGDATTQDIIELIAAGRRRVFEQTGVKLETEVQVLGDVDLALWQKDSR